MQLPAAPPTIFFAVINTRTAVWVLLASGVGCATPMSALREDNHRLTETVSELRADRRTQARKLRDLEHQIAMIKEKTYEPADVPQLPVEVVAPPRATSSPDLPSTDARVVGIADDGSEIVYVGDAALGKSATFDDDPPRRTTRAPAPPVARTSDRLEVTHHVPKVSAAARAPRRHVRGDREVQPMSDQPAAEYRAAVELVRAGKHDEAVAALHAFLKAYPRHDYADNAQYWLGETYYAQKDYAHALAEFRATIETYPRGNKVPDALLKVGYCYLAIGQTEKARAVLEQVVNLYPKSEPAALASKRLETP